MTAVVLFRLFFRKMIFNCLKRFVADVVLDLAGVIRRNLWVNAESDKRLGEDRMALIYFLRNIESVGGERNIAVLVNKNIISAFE